MKILMAYDGSPQATRGLEWAGRFDGEVSVTLIAVTRTLGGSEAIADAVDPTLDPTSEGRALEDAARRLADQGIDVHVVRAAGNPAERIIDVAETGEFDLIVMGTRGLNAMERFLMGSTSERVARFATRPVLLVR